MGGGKIKHSNICDLWFMIYISGAKVQQKNEIRKKKRKKITGGKSLSNFGTPLPLRGGFPPKLQPHVCAHTQALSP